MAYARDPLQVALSEVGRNLRDVSGDILQRRRLDLAEQQQLADAERQRELATLRAEAQRSQGQLDVLKTRGSLAELGQQMELRGAQEQRAQQLHGPALSLAQWEAGPGLQLREQEAQAGIAQRRAGAAASAESAATSRLQRQQIQQEMAWMDAPLTDPQAAALVGGLYGDLGLQTFTSIVPPGMIKTRGDLIRLGNLIAKGAPEAVKDRMMDQLASQIAQLPPNDPNRRRLEEQRTMLLQNRGIVLGKNVSARDLAQGGLQETMTTLQTITGQPDRDPDLIRGLLHQYDLMEQLETVHRSPEEVQGARALRVLPIEQEFAPIAQQQVEAEARQRGTVPEEQIPALIYERQKALARQYGTPEHMRRQLEAARSQATPTLQQAAPAATAPGRPPAQTPPAQTELQRREAERAQQGLITEAVRLNIPEAYVETYVNMRQAGFDQRQAFTRIQQAIQRGQ